jgi:hypothetical protein
MIQLHTQNKGFVKHLGVCWYNKKREEEGERYLEANMNDTVESIINTYKKIEQKPNHTRLQECKDKVQRNTRVKHTRLLSTEKS